MPLSSGQGQGGSEGLETARDAPPSGGAVAPRAPRGDPRGNGLGRLRELKALPGCGASSLETQSRGGIRVDPHTGRTRVV
jgi:hypothetical protein